MHEITLTAPDDWHCHLRDDVYLKRTVPDTSAQFKRALVMPNLLNPITRVSEAETYYHRIKEHVPKTRDFEPLMTLYLTDTTSKSELIAAKQSPIIIGCKLYPAGATTHSDKGVTSLKNIYPLLETLQKIDLPLLVHAEMVDPDISPLDREAVFIEREFLPLLKHFPALRMVFEHISTKEAVDFVRESDHLLAATITPHHLILTQKDCQQLGPHGHCLPMVKSLKDQNALIDAAISGDPKFFLGTDSAPHPKTQKESTHIPAGIYNAPIALSVYAEIFHKKNALAKLEGFASIYGPRFYQLPANTTEITLIHKPLSVPDFLPFGSDVVVPLMAGETLHWQIKHEQH